MTSYLSEDELTEFKALMTPGNPKSFKSHLKESIEATQLRLDRDRLDAQSYVASDEPESVEDDSLVRINMMNMLSPRRLMQEVDRELKYWGYTYYSEVLAEIKRSSGIKAVMGQLLKRNMKTGTVNEPAPMFVGTTQRFERINSAVARMPLKAKKFIHRHYAINEDREDYRNGQNVVEFARRVGINIRTYNRQLKDCKEVLVALGVL